MNGAQTAERIAREARALGFTTTGASPLAASPRSAFVTAWLAEGRAGEMAWLARRTAERTDPRRRFPWAASVVSLAYPYRPPPPPPDDWRTSLRGRIAAYARGADYHDRVLALLETLAERLRRWWPSARFRPYVDTGPLLERELAARAGLGWVGKHTLLLGRGGSWFFLAELVTDLLVESAAADADHCGGCTRCLAACPTDALTPYAMDARRCLSYLTIEHRSAIPLELRPKLENWIFGCDACQEACPWNGDASDGTDAAWLTPSLPELLALDAAGFRARFGKTAVTRTKRRGLLRNVAVALGNSGNRDAVPSLTAALEDREPLVRGHAAWALGRIGGELARAALERAARNEIDAAVVEEVRSARSAAG